MTIFSTDLVAGRLADPDLGSWLTAVGLAEDDVADLQRARRTVLAHPVELPVVAELAQRLDQRIGDFSPPPPDLWRGAPADVTGLVPLLALLVTAPELAAYHTRRGVSAEVSVATLADLGQQVRAHRRGYGGFGLHTHAWLAEVWSGGIYRLGRLMFQLYVDEPPGAPAAEVLSVHIPPTGPLTPAAVDDAFARATPFFAEHFPDHPTRDFHCFSWLLDPALGGLGSDANLAAFQRRWTLHGPIEPGEAEVLYFAFNLRSPMPYPELPTDTALRRLVRRHLMEGSGWSLVHGRTPQ